MLFAHTFNTISAVNPIKNMRVTTFIVAIIALAGLSITAPADPVEPGRLGDINSHKNLSPIGIFVRSVLGIELYEISLYSYAPRRIAELILAAEPRLKFADEALISGFLLNPDSHVPLCLKIKSLTDLKNWHIESAAIRDALARTGLFVDAEWQILKGTASQADVLEYADAIVGLSRDKPDSVFRVRRKNDSVVLTIDENDQASIQFFRERESGDIVHIRLRSADILRRVFTFYLSGDTGRLDLTGMSPALLRGIHEELNARLNG